MLFYKRWRAMLATTKNFWDNYWVKWIHQPTGIIHCIECLQLDGCYFLFANVPMYPQHEKCHCSLEAVDYAVVEKNAVANSSYEKFCPYLFNTNGLYFHGKEKLFEQWGYTSEDAKWLQEEMEWQAREKYLVGEYRLGRLDVFGQRVNITIEIPKKNGVDTVTIPADGCLNLVVNCN